MISISQHWQNYCLLLEHLPTKLTVLKESAEGTDTNSYVSNISNQELPVQLNQLRFGTVDNNEQAKNCLLLPSKR